MLMQTIKIAAVEYINTLPFLHGISQKLNDEPISVIAADPANCAALYQNKEVDIALVPIGALNHIGEHTIITDYCIGSDGAVDTVALLSQHPIQEIKHIQLDSHSRTSANLIQILCKEYWNINPTFSKSQNQTLDGSILLIGDKVKEYEGQYAFKYDLGFTWKQFANLPMVYAVWIARNGVNPEIITKLNNAFDFSITNLDAVPLNGYSNKIYWQHYMRHSINYHLNTAAKQGMQHFLNLCKELKL